MKRILLLVVIVALGAGGAYYWWISSPQYAVQQAVSAIKQHNVAAFHNWVDVHQVSSSAIDDLTAEPMTAMGSGELLTRMIGMSLLGLLRPVAVDALDGQIDKMVATVPHGHVPIQPAQSNYSTNSQPYAGGAPVPYGTSREQIQQNNVGSPFSSAETAEEEDTERPSSIFGALKAMVRPPSLTRTLKDFGFSLKNFRGVGDCQTQGDLAYVPLKFFSPKLNNEVPVVLELHHESGHWQVTRIANLQDDLQLISQTEHLSRGANPPI